MEALLPALASALRSPSWQLSARCKRLAHRLVPSKAWDEAKSAASGNLVLHPTCRARALRAYTAQECASGKIVDKRNRGF